MKSGPRSPHYPARPALERDDELDELDPMERAIVKALVAILVREIRAELMEPEDDSP